MPQYSDIELLFILDTLERHQEYLEELFIRDIGRKKMIKSKTLLSGFEQGHYTKSFQKGNSGVLQLKFPDYGRWVEIQYHKKKKIPILETSKSASKWGVKKDSQKKRKRKNTSWYTRNVYGSLNKLIGTLMFGLSDIERERLKEFLGRLDKK